jgi:hypothetical protein
LVTVIGVDEETDHVVALSSWCKNLAVSLVSRIL